MFENLPETNRKREKNLGQNILSLVVHAGLIFGAIEATKGAAEQLTTRNKDTTMMFVEAPKPPPPPPPQQQVIIAANPPPQGFQTITPPTDIPTEIPPVDLNQKFDPRDFTGKGVEGGVGSGVVGGTGPVPTVEGAVFMSSEVDEIPARISGPEMRYPPAMQSAGIPGKVTLQYVVDTLGHIREESVKVITASNNSFIEPAREALLKSVFKPGKQAGKAVQVLVQQAYVFKPGQ